MEAFQGKRRMLLSALALALVLILAIGGLAGCQEQGAQHDGNPGKLDIGIAFPENDWRTAFLKDFAEEIEQKSNGSIQTKMHYMDEYRDMQDLLKEIDNDTGRLDIVLSANAYLADYTYPEFYVSGLPYLFEDFEDAWRFADSDINAEIEGRLPQYGMRILSHFCGGFRDLGSIREIEEPADLKGLVVATVKSPILMDMLFMLGANPQPSVAGELYDALEKGVYNAVEVSIPTFWRDEDYQYLPYVAVTNHSYNMWSLIIDEDTWQGLPPNEQAIIKSAAEKYAEFERAESKRNIEEVLANLDEAGVTITYPDHDTFEAATEEVRLKYSRTYADTYQAVKSYLNDGHSS